MRNRKNIPIAALRAFEAAARHGQLTAAAEELAVTHGAVSRQVSHLEALIGTALFEGARNRPKLTAEGRVFGLALTAAFDQMEEALRIIANEEDYILDVACLSTFAIRWLIPRLHDFTNQHPRYDVRLATDSRPPRTHVDVQISVLSPDEPMPGNGSLLFREQLGMIVAPSTVGPGLQGIENLPRLETRTRPQVWHEWSLLSKQAGHKSAPTSRTFDHYHLTIEAALCGLGAAIVPWHLVAGDVASGRLTAPYGFIQSNYQYIVRIEPPSRRKTEHFVKWLKDAITEFPRA